MTTTGMTTMEVKKINKSTIYSLIYSEKSISKQMIAQKLNIGLTTVTQNLKILEEEKLIERNGHYESTGGRKAQAIQINCTARISIGVDILKDCVHIVAITLYGDILNSSTIDIKFESSDQYFYKLGNSINSFIEMNLWHKDIILGVGIAIQGIISNDGKTISYGKILTDTGLNLDNISKYIPYNCILEHDSKAAAYVELWNHKNLKDAVVFLLNRNFGSAVIVNREVHYGINMHSGVIEHMCINHNGPLCYCGSQGCLETYCSANSLQKSAGEDLDSFFKKLREDDSFCNKIWIEYLDNLAIAIRNLNVILDCNIIVSGFLAPYLIQEDINSLNERVSASLPFPIIDNFITLSHYGELSPAIGSALILVDKFLKTI
ncbi:ROK family transcriptional regulator [Clostridium uliginosum]|uniref:Sugar kinase of the NBD/HSP70 family, may contain an N-terminal HTH domain n=1 Tax=Clostridium uliginosum TaxID=119641 RepID=A0A1I1MRX5_9CLOT|nr:ROK family transcriptional regulator [Clostridium uliginosum]SFC88111.1 Sugar kinase of the NBD/HSP70 family, may contain an N-terminal HTH domain [Clostridium uliginosum]